MRIYRIYRVTFFSPWFYLLTRVHRLRRKVK